MFIKVIDWLRLFSPTALYINLMTATILEIRYFMIIMFIWYMAFGTVFYYINIIRGEEPLVDEYNHEHEVSIVPKIYNFWVLDAFVNQYELSLGDWKTEEMANGEDIETGPSYYKLLFTLFLFASFLLHIVFLNMLIAIMGDTFDRVQEKKQLRKRETELSKISEYVDVIPVTEDYEYEAFNDESTPFERLICCFACSKNDSNETEDSQVPKKIPRKNNLYVLETDQENKFSASDEWEGRVVAIQNFVTHSLNATG